MTGPLPEPATGGSLDTLWSALNVAEKYRPVVAALLVSELMPNLPHPVTLLTGEQGVGKTTATRRLASIIDPSPVQVRKAPKDAEAATTAAAGSWVVALDNLSSIPDWLSDCLCRWSTGEGDVRRQLYSDGGLFVFAFRRVPLINGIDVGAVRGDLADRLVHIGLEKIPDQSRRKEEELEDEWQRAHPLVLGALLDLTVNVLRTLPSIKLDTLPRMADYATVLGAVDKVLGAQGLETYLGLRDELAQDAMSSDPVLIELANTVTETFTGTSAELLAVITPRDDRGRAPKDWPANALALTGILHRQAPTLRSLGWTVDSLARTGRAKAIRWSLVPPPRDDTDPKDDTDREGKENPPASPALPAQGDVFAGQNPNGHASTTAGNAPDAGTTAGNAARIDPDARNAVRTATRILTSTNEDHAGAAGNAGTDSASPPSEYSYEDEDDTALRLIMDQLGAIPIDNHGDQR